MSFSTTYLSEVRRIVSRLKTAPIEKMAIQLARVRARGGRLFILGVGGSAANASHAVNDFRKIAGIECYAPTDNVSELTARTNDEGWASVFSEWLKGSHLNRRDALLVLSVGGGDLERNISPNLVAAIQLARTVRATVLGIWPRERLHRQGGGCVCRHSNRECLTDHAARRGLSSRRLAPAGLPPQGPKVLHQVGVG